MMFLIVKRKKYGYWQKGTETAAAKSTIE